MFGDFTYALYTLVFCIPPTLLLWRHRAFSPILRRELRPILYSTLVLTLYGNALWPIARKLGAWSYSSDKIIGEFFEFFVLEDVLWWLCVSFLFSSFVTISTFYENRGMDIVLQKARVLLLTLRKLP